VSLITAVVEIIVDHYVDPHNNALSAAGSISAEGVSLLARCCCRVPVPADQLVRARGEDATLGQSSGRCPGWPDRADIVVTLLVVPG